MNTSTTESDLISSLVNAIIEANKLQEKMVCSGLELLSKEALVDFDAYIKYCLKNNMDINYLSRCYELITRESFREQMYFKRHREYRYSRFEEVSGLVYYNNEYMSQYMTGLALTSFLWPNHVVIRDFFSKMLPKNVSGSYLEIGPGHGFNMMTAMRETRYCDFLGIDISPASVELTKSILRDSTFGVSNRYDIIEADFLKWSPKKKFDAIVIGEVLEHVENPVDFLLKAKDCCNDHSFVYVTSAINAPAVDHIYLYKSEAEIEDQILSCGFRIHEKLLCPYYGTSVEESKENKLPINIAIVLRRISE